MKPSSLKLKHLKEKMEYTHIEIVFTNRIEEDSLKCKLYFLS